MREITIDKSSWHYWFANFGTGANTDDFCAYVRSVFGGMFIILVLVLAFVFVSFLCGDFIAWVIATLIHGWIDPDGAVGGLLFLLAIGILVGTIYLLIEGARATTRESEFLKATYSSIKDKICFKVRIQ